MQYVTILLSEVLFLAVAVLLFRLERRVAKLEASLEADAELETAYRASTRRAIRELRDEVERLELERQAQVHSAAFASTHSPKMFDEGLAEILGYHLEPSKPKAGEENHD